MKFGCVSALPFLLFAVGCRDEVPTGSSSVDAGSDRDGAVTAVVDGGTPAAGDASPAGSSDTLSNDNLTVAIDDSADELTIVGQWSTDVASSATERDASAGSGAAPDASTPTSGSGAVNSASSSGTGSDVGASAETDALSSVVTTDVDAAVDTPSTSTAADAAITSDTTSELGSVSNETASSESAASSETFATTSAESTPGDDAGAPSRRLEGCTRVAGERPATTPTLNAPQVAGLELGVGTAGQALAGSVQFQDAENDATTLIVQVGSEAEHYLCTLSDDDLGGGSVDLDVLSLGSAFPEGGHTLYVAIADNAGNVSGYLVGTLTVGVNSAQAVCGQAPRLLIGAVPSQSTTFYEERNGSSADYDAGSPLAIVASTDLYLKLDACGALRLAGDAAGQGALGWDNCLLVEYRPTPEAPREAVWSYCSLPVFEKGTYDQVPMASEAPSVAGTALNPPIPNSAAFGWPAGTLDLMRYVPANHPNEFVLNLRLLDFGSYGSTTDIWLSAETGATALD